MLMRRAQVCRVTAPQGCRPSQRGSGLAGLLGSEPTATCRDRSDDPRFARLEGL
jgi:hypothetical protein